MGGHHEYKLPRSGLTLRQLEILSLVREGHSNWQIGQELGIKESTVKNLMRETAIRLDASDRTHCVIKAIRQGLLSL